MTYKHPATPTGWSLTNAADAAAARTAIDFRSGAREFSPYINLRDWDAVRNANWKSLLGASYSVGSAILNTSGCTDGTPLTAADVGKVIMLLLDGTGAENWWKGTILSVSSGVATLSNPISVGSGYIGRVRYGFDGTTAINEALAEVDATSSGSVEVYLGGSYRLTQLVIPEHVTLRGMHWHKQQVGQLGYSGRTILRQLAGAEKDFVVFQATTISGFEPAITASGLYDFELRGPEINVVGLPAATTGNGVAFRDVRGAPAIPIDGFKMARIHAYNFPESGFRSYGAIPFYVNECSSWFNGRYGFEHARYGGNSTNALHFFNFSGDWNNLGLLGFRLLQHLDTVFISGVKSEGHANSVEANSTRGAPNFQSNAIVFENCDRTPVLINGVSHLRIARAATAAGPAITIRDTAGQGRRPKITFNAVNVVLNEINTPADISASVTLRDEVGGIDIPRSINSGYYPSMPAPAAITGDNGNTLLRFADTVNAATHLRLYNNTQSSPPVLAAEGSTSTNISIALAPKGTGGVEIGQSGTGVTPRLVATGADTNISLNLQSKNSGKVLVNSIEAVRRTVQTVTTATTLGANGDYVVFISGANGAVTLPTAVGNTGRYTLKNIHTADKTVSTTSSQTIDGGTLTILPGDSVDVISDGPNWRIV
jgi:hypothetical protein